MVRIERLQGENHSISAMFHRKFMCGKMTVVGCPKLGLVDYSEKLQEILHTNDIYSYSYDEISVCGETIVVR